MIKTGKYNFSFTAGGLLLSESVKVAEIYIHEQNWDKLRQRILDENILQARAYSTLKRLCPEICSRLKLLNDDELQILVNGSRQEQLNILWLAICRRHRFIYDFAVEVVREKYLRLDTEVRQEDYDIFFNTKADWHHEMDELSDSTRSKLRQVVFKMLREAELLDKNGMINPGMLTSRLAKTIARHSNEDLTIFPVSDLEIRQLLK